MKSVSRGIIFGENGLSITGTNVLISKNLMDDLILEDKFYLHEFIKVLKIIINKELIIQLSDEELFDFSYLALKYFKNVKNK